MAFSFRRGMRGTMAAKSRSKRKMRAPKKRRSNNRVSKIRVKPPRKRAAAKAAPRVIEAALASFAHEVRTPLTGILAISNLLATSDLGERERRWVGTIKAGAEHSATLGTLVAEGWGSLRRACGLERV